MRVKSSRIENGQETCNTCGRPADSPYRYQYTDAHEKRVERGCIASCHDVHVRVNTKPNWMAPRHVMPRWILAARKAIKNFEQFEA